MPVGVYSSKVITPNVKFVSLQSLRSDARVDEWRIFGCDALQLCTLVSPMQMSADLTCLFANVQQLPITIVRLQAEDNRGKSLLLHRSKSELATYSSRSCWWLGGDEGGGGDALNLGQN